MATVLEAGRGSAASNTHNISTTLYLPTGDSCASSSTEANVAITRRTAGTFSALYIRLISNGVTASSTFRFRVALANGTQLISVPASTAGEFQDTAHADTVTAGQRTAVQVITGGTGTSLVLGMAGLLFTDGSGNTTKRVTSNSVSQYASTTTLRFIPLVGSGGGTAAAEATTQFKIKTAGTLKNMFAVVFSNTLTRTTTIVSRINTAGGTQALSVLTTATGVFEDTTHTDTTASGTLANFGVSNASGGSGAIAFGNVSCEFTTTNSQTHAFGGEATPPAIATNLTRYSPWGGITDNSAGDWSTTESDVQALAQGPFTVSFLACELLNNTVSAASTLTFRKNGAGGNQSVSITASTAGYFEDATNSDIVTATDEVNYKLVTGGTGTSLAAGVLGTLVSYNVFMPMWNFLQPQVLFDRIGVLPSGEI